MRIFRFFKKQPESLNNNQTEKEIGKNDSIRKTESKKINKETWRRNWLLMIKDLTNFEYQKKTWLDSNKTNPYYSFVEFMCSYFDDLDLTDGYEKHIKSDLVTIAEYEAISEWHKSLSEYESPTNDDYDNRAILNDEKWIEIIGLGKKSMELLKPNLTKIERSLLI